MAERRERMLVTGGAGFIGSHLVDVLLARPNTDVTVLDRLSYAGTRANLAHHEPDPRFRFVLGDVAEPADVAPLVEWADTVVHAAAESHVDRSIEDSREFVVSNVLGTQIVLEACRELGRPLLIVSTDEVYGSREGEPFAEDDPMLPRNPYAASKAAADLLCTPTSRRTGRTSRSCAGRTPSARASTWRRRSRRGRWPRWRADRFPCTARAAPPRVAVRPRLRARDGLVLVTASRASSTTSATATS